MWWRESGLARGLARLAVVLAAASLTAGCFQPLYGTPASGTDSVHDKLAEVEIAPITMRRGTPQARLAVDMHNALQFDLNGGAGANAPTHRLVLTVSATGITVNVNQQTGLATAQIGGVIVGYQLIEIATGKVVVQDTTREDVDFDLVSGQQFFAQQRAQRDAQDRAVQLAAEAIRNRLASYFVAGT